MSNGARRNSPRPNSECIPDSLYDIYRSSKGTYFCRRHVSVKTTYNQKPLPLSIEFQTMCSKVHGRGITPFGSLKHRRVCRKPRLVTTKNAARRGEDAAMTCFFEQAMAKNCAVSKVYTYIWGGFRGSIDVYNNYAIHGVFGHYI